MRGSIIKRSRTSWALVIDQGRDASGKRKQRWIKYVIDPGLSTRDNTKAAQAKLAELLHQFDKGTHVDASKLTLVEYCARGTRRTSSRIDGRKRCAATRR